MFELFVPYLIGTAMGMSVPDNDEGPLALAPALQAATSTAPSDRAPDPQTATGQFTTATEVKPILEMTQGNWVAVRSYEGQDLLYFTHLMSWRCGLWDIRYGLNGAPPTEVLAMEPCHLDTNAPNGMTALEDFPPYVTLPADFVTEVTVAITYDDGTEAVARFDRNRILIP